MEEVQVQVVADLQRTQARAEAAEERAVQILNFDTLNAEL
jgi:hypothetical protein